MKRLHRFWHSQLRINSCYPFWVVPLSSRPAPAGHLSARWQSVPTDFPTACGLPLPCCRRFGLRACFGSTLGYFRSGSLRYDEKMLLLDCDNCNFVLLVPFACYGQSCLVKINPINQSQGILLLFSFGCRKLFVNSAEEWNEESALKSRS